MTPQKYSEKTLDKYRHINVAHDWWDSVYEDFRHVCDILGIELATNEPSFSGFSSQGDGASWVGVYRPIEWVMLERRDKYNYELAPAAIREYAPKDEELHRIADELCFLGRFYQLRFASVVRHNTKYSHSGTMAVSYIEFESGEVSNGVYNVVHDTAQQLFRDLADWLYKQLETEYGCLVSDEAVSEALEANEIEEDEEDDVCSD